jgi:hypothetical protein
MYELPVQGQKKSNATRLNMTLDSGIAGAEAAAQCDGERVAAQNRERWMASNPGQEPLRAPSVRQFYTCRAAAARPSMPVFMKAIGVAVYMDSRRVVLTPQPAKFVPPAP